MWATPGMPCITGGRHIGFKPVAYSGLETGNREFASYVLESGQARFVVSAAYTPDQRNGRPPHGAWRRRQGHRAGSGRCGEGLEGNHLARRQIRLGAARSRRMISASSAPRPSTPTARPCTSSWIAATIRASSPPPIARSRTRKRIHRPGRHRPHRRQRAARQDERVGASSITR